MKIRKTYIIALVLLVILCLVIPSIGCRSTAGSYWVNGSGKLVTRTLDFKDFTRLEISSAFEVEVIQASTFSVSITTDDNAFDDIDVRQLGGSLRIGLKIGHAYMHVTRRATITMPDLQSIDISGASKADVSGFNASADFNIQVSGASSLKLNDITTGNTDFEISGASKANGNIEIGKGDFEVSGASSVDLNGKAGNVNIDVSGASSARLGDFTVADAVVNASGASNATVNAAGKLDVNVSGASRLYYLGSPTLGNVQITGASTMSRK